MPEGFQDAAWFERSRIRTEDELDGPAESGLEEAVDHQSDDAGQQQGHEDPACALDAASDPRCDDQDGREHEDAGPERAGPAVGEQAEEEGGDVITNHLPPLEGFSGVKNRRFIHRTDLRLRRVVDLRLGSGQFRLLGSHHRHRGRRRRNVEQALLDDGAVAGP